MTLYSQIAANRRRTFFLFFFTFLIIISLGYLFGAYYGDSYAGALLAFLFTIFYSLVSYFFSAQIVLSIAGAKPIKKSDNQKKTNLFFLKLIKMPIKNIRVIKALIAKLIGPKASSEW